MGTKFKFMQFECIQKLKKGFFNTYYVGDIISAKKFLKLNASEQRHFKPNYEDESFQEQWERNRIEDDKKEK